MTDLVHGFRLPKQAPFPHPAAAAYSDRALELSARPHADVVSHRDIAFGDADWQRFDLFTPAQSTGKRPVLIFFHGGGWLAGFKEWTGLMAPGVIGSGAILAASTYRFAPEHRYPTFLEDSFDAYAAIRTRVAAFGGDPDRIYVSGHSAGGHIAAMIALRPDLAEGRAAGLAGALPISAILDLVHAAPPPESLEEMVYTHILTRPEDDVGASPVSWVANAAVPFAFAWGEQDTERVRRSNTEIARRFAAAGKPHTADCLAGLDHFGTHLALADPAHPWFVRFRAMLSGAE